MSQEYSLDDLFRTTTKVEIKLPGGSTKTLHLRTLAATEDEGRRRYAIKEARVMRNRLKTPESVDYQAEIAPVFGADREILETTLIDVKRGTLFVEAIRLVEQVHYPEPPEDADLKQIMETEDDKDKVKQDLAEARKDYVEKGLEAYQKEISAIDLERLREVVAEVRLDRLCEDRYNSAYSDATVFYSTFTDPKRTKRLVQSSDDAGSIDPGVYTQIRNAYDSMDIWGRSDNLKN